MARHTAAVRAAEGHRPAESSRLVRLGAYLTRAGALRPESDGGRRAMHAAVAVLVLSGIALAIVAQATGLSGQQVSVSPGWLALAVGGFAALELMYAALWRLICRLLGHAIAARRSRAIWCASALARYVPTGMMMFVLRGALAQRAGMSLRLCYASTLYEVALIFAGAGAVGAYLVFTLSAFDSLLARGLVVGATLLALGCIHPKVFARLSAAVLTRLGREPLPTVLRGHQLFGLLALYALAFGFGGLCLLVLAEALYDVPAGDAAVIVAAFPLGTVASVLGSLLPGGLGARELGLVVAMSTVMPASEALVLAIAVRLVQIALEFVLTGVTQVVAFAPRSHRRYQELGLRNRRPQSSSESRQ